MKSTVNDLDIIPLLRFLLWRNILFSNLFFLSFHFLPPFFLLPSSNARFHQSAYLPSTSSNSFLTSLSILPQTFCHPTHTMLWDALDMNNFYFLFLLFSDFIGILFSFSFSFLLDNKEACDKEVT